MRHRMLLPALLGCQGAPDAGAESSPAGEPLESTAHDPDLPEIASPDPVSLVHLSEGLDLAVQTMLSLDPRPYHDLWTRVFWSNQGEDCPSMQLHNGMDYWDDRCTSPTGAQFIGWTLNFREESYQETPGVWMHQMDWLSGHAVITLPSGAVLEHFGDVLHQRLRIDIEGGGVETWRGFIYGDFSFTGAPSAGGWLGADVSHESYFDYALHPDGHREVDWDFAMGPLPGPVVAATTSGLHFSSAPSGCKLEPEGTVQLRDAAGRWVEVVFDPASVCDGCGLARHDGETLGQVCAPFEQVLDWGEAGPWED